MRKIVVKPGYFYYTVRKYVIFNETKSIPGFNLVKTINYTPAKGFFRDFELDALMSLGITVEIRAVR